MAFKIAGAMALRSGCKKADPTILEPIMKCEVTMPEQYAGDVIGDLNSRRAKISEMGDRGHLKFVRCTVPLSEMFGYATLVRAISQGRASFTMEPSHYEEVPPGQWRASTDPHSPDEPPTASAGRPVRPIRPKPGLSGGERKQFPPSQ
jgi:translation elongation factor EF-G